MSEYFIKKYQSADKQIWDSFIENSEHSTFLFQRNFMDYHKNRFEDYSLLIFKDKRVISILPAHKQNNDIYSHRGLSYGELIFHHSCEIKEKQNIYKKVLVFLDSKEFKNFFLKEIPHFYYSDNSKNIVTLDGFFPISKTIKKNLELVIDYSKPLQIHKSKLKNFRKNQSNHFLIKEDCNFDEFWNSILIPRLKEKFNSKPVHTLDEIKKLKKLFPKNIIQYNILKDENILAGITVFNKNTVVKSQYGISTLEGEKERALEYLFIKLIHKYKDEGKGFFSMGTVNDHSERGYNLGMLNYKKELGCVVVHQNHIQIPIEDNLDL